MLRIGILFEGDQVPMWVNAAVLEISQLKNIEWAVAIQNPKASESENFLFKIFRNLDRSLLPGKPDLTSNVKLGFLNNVPVIEASAQKLTSKELDRIRETNPDILLHFGAEIPDPEILRLPKHGVWGLFDGTSETLLNEFTGFHEWFLHQPTSTIYLGQLIVSPLEIKQQKSSSIKTEYLSLNRNQTAIFSKAIDLFVRKVSHLADAGKSEELKSIPVSRQGRENRMNFWVAFLSFWKLSVRLIAKSLNKIFFLEQWVLFYSLEPLELPQLLFRKFKELIPPKDRIWADPFVVTQGNKHYIFIEELLLKTNKGHISCLVLDQNGKIESSEIIIDKPYHLSYPFIFQHNNSWYMIPESADNQTVDLFECTAFPFQWRFKKSLLTGVQAYDTTLHFHSGKFWLFCTIKKREGASTDDDLHIFYAEDFLSSEWMPHPYNPVLSDPSVARPAGKIFSFKNELYRPSQIGVPRYGYGLSLNKITALSETLYTEEIVSKAIPDWKPNLLSVHTFNFTESITVIDGQLKRFKF